MIYSFAGALKLQIEMSLYFKQVWNYIHKVQGILKYQACLQIPIVIIDELNYRLTEKVEK